MVVAVANCCRCFLRKFGLLCYKSTLGLATHVSVMLLRTDRALVTEAPLPELPLTITTLLKARGRDWCGKLTGLHLGTSYLRLSMTCIKK